MILTMERKYSAYGGVYSLLTYDLDAWWVMEREWMQNLTNVSCVPPGLYDLVPHSSERYPSTWALVGDTVSHYPEPGIPRSTCVLHRASRPNQLKGCLTVCETVSARGTAEGAERAMDDMRLILGRHDQNKLLIIGGGA